MKSTYYQLSSRLLLIVVVLVGASACLQTNIMPVAIQPEAQRLASLNQRKIAVLIDSRLPAPLPLGHQYLFLIVPFGRISLERAENYLYPLVRHELSLRGYQAILQPRSLPSLGVDTEELHITITGMEISALDLIFTRRMTGSVSLIATRGKASSEVLNGWQGTNAESDYVQFAFEPELTHLFNKINTHIIQNMLNQLNL